MKKLSHSHFVSTSSISCGGHFPENASVFSQVLVSITDIYLSGLLARCQNAWSQDGGNMRVIANGIDHWPALSSACGRFLFCFVCFFRVIWIFQDKIQLYKPKVLVFNECFPLLWHFYTSIVKTGQGNLLSLVSSSSFVSVLLLYVSYFFASKATNYLVNFLYLL